jgi:predicted acyl esterase
LGNQTTRHEQYKSDNLKLVLEGYAPKAQQVPYGTKVDGIYFDGYPQILKGEDSAPVYTIKLDKDVKVPMRDGIQLYTDVYRPMWRERNFPHFWPTPTGPGC